MEPVVGVDVAKGSSVVQAFRKRNEPYGKAVDIEHGTSGFEQFGEMLGIFKLKRGWLQWWFWKQQDITTVHWFHIWIEVATPITW